MPSYHPQPNRGDKTLGNSASSTEKFQERFTLFQKAFALYIKSVSQRENLTAMMHRCGEGMAKNHLCKQVAELKVFVSETNASLWMIAVQSSDTEELP